MRVIICLVLCSLVLYFGIRHIRNLWRGRNSVLDRSLPFTKSGLKKGEIIDVVDPLYPEHNGIYKIKKVTKSTLYLE